MQSRAFQNLVGSKVSQLRRLPLGIVIVMSLIIFIGILFIHSATNDYSNGALAYRTGQAYSSKQIQFLAISTLAMLTVATFDYRKLASMWLFLFLAAMAILILCVLIGREINGAKSWIVVGGFGIQVAEYAKILYILCLAGFYRDRKGLNSWKTLAVPGIVTMALLVFILGQPDFGTAMVFVPIFFLLAWCSGAPMKILAPLLTLGAALLPTAYFSGLLKDHQLRRIDTWIASLTGEGMDRSGDGYHVWMSQNAIGSGGVSGSGYGEGMFSQFDYLPERHTDFIFSVIAEEQGYIGCILFLLLYFVLLMLCLRVAIRARDAFGRLICVGIATMYFAHFMINVGMTCGVMPVTGIPLLLVSYGGSSLMTSMMAIGLVMSVHLHSNEKTQRKHLAFSQGASI